MSRYSELSDEELAYVREKVAAAPPLNETQQSVIRAAFAGCITVRGDLHEAS